MEAIKLLDFGSPNLGTRLYAKEVVRQLPNSNSILFDFTGISFMSMSFATELFGHLEGTQGCSYQVINIDPYVNRRMEQALTYVC